MTDVLSTGEQITLDNFELLTDSDLKDLGFVLGHRRLLLAWIARQQTQKNGVEVANACSPSPSAASSAASPLSDASGNLPRSS